MFFKLAVNNVKRSIRDYAIYFFTLTFGVCLFYVFNSMDSQQAMMALDANQKEILQMLTNAIGYVSVFISVILGFLIVYANRFLMKRRKKELGIYLLLGMDKSKISHILIIETFMIGIFSLGVGLTIGIFASQGLSAITARLFEMDLSSFQFTFSMGSFIKTLIYFGIIFVIVMVFNTISISKYKLITLLQANSKNESFKVRKIWISIIAFILSIGCIGAAYYLVLTRGWDSMQMMLTCIVLGCIGTLLFFFSISGILLQLIRSNKKLYYKGLNMFVFRQLSSKINTAFISMGIICLMLFVTMVTFSTGMSIANAASTIVKHSAPYDISITESGAYNENTHTVHFKSNNAIEDLNLQDSLNKYAKNSFQISFYDSIFKMSDIPNLVPNIPESAVQAPLRAISLTDYNKVLASQGQEPISLQDNQFAITGNNTMVSSYYKMKNDQTITLNGTSYQLGVHKLMDTSLTTEYGLMDSGTIILPDKALANDKPDSRTINVAYKQSDSAYANEASDAIKKHFNNGNGHSNEHPQINSILDRQLVYKNNIGGSVLTSFISIYIGLVFLITCVAILALQQLAEASDNTFRYNLLRKLGTDEKMINRALFKQIAIYFAVPIILAIVHAVVGIYFANYLVQMLGSGNNILYISLITAGIMLIIYGGYFLATYFGCKGMIRTKKK